MSNPTSCHLIQITIIKHGYKNHFSKDYARKQSLGTLEPQNIRTYCPAHATNQPKLTLRGKRKPSILQRENIVIENFLRTCIQLLYFSQKHSPKSESGLLRFYSMQCLIRNSLKKKVRQRLSDLSDLRNFEQKGRAKPKRSSGFRTKTLGCFMRCH